MTVFVAHNPTKGRSDRYHEDRECSRLTAAHGVIERDRDELPADAEPCQWCEGEGPERHQEGNGGLWQQLDEASADAVGGSSA